MPHMVAFRTKEGKPGYHWADTLDDAVRFVEHLRNNEQVDDSKVYRMTEVPIEFKVLYKVEVGGSTDSSDSSESSTSSGSSSGGFAGSTEMRGSSDGPGPVRAEGRSAQPAVSGEGRSNSGSSNGPTSPSAETGASPVAQAGGRFGLFSRA